MKTTKDLVNVLMIEMALVQKLQRKQGLGFQAFKILMAEEESIIKKIRKLTT